MRQPRGSARPGVAWRRILVYAKQIDFPAILHIPAQRNAMPYVNIRIAGTLSREQKAKIAEEITETLERIAHKPASYTYIAFDEMADENWAIAGKLLDEE
jgi:4-oxalocrotonate tautomerase